MTAVQTPREAALEHLAELPPFIAFTVTCMKQADGNLEWAGNVTRAEGSLKPGGVPSMTLIYSTGTLGSEEEVWLAIWQEARRHKEAHEREHHEQVAG